MPKIMEPQRYIKVENVKKREPGHEYIDPTSGQKMLHFHPGWYWFAYRPIKHGPYPNEEAALLAGCEASAKKRAS